MQFVQFSLAQNRTFYIFLKMFVTQPKSLYYKAKKLFDSLVFQVSCVYFVLM